jgi:hypothetical protein
MKCIYILYKKGNQKTILQFRGICDERGKKVAAS